MALVRAARDGRLEALMSTNGIVMRMNRMTAYSKHADVALFLLNVPGVDINASDTEGIKKMSFPDCWSFRTLIYTP